MAKGEEGGVKAGKRWGEREAGVNLGVGGRERSLFFSLCATKAVRANNEHGEWCVSREALSRVS